MGRSRRSAGPFLQGPSGSLRRPSMLPAVTAVIRMTVIDTRISAVFVAAAIGRTAFTAIAAFVGVAVAAIAFRDVAFVIAGIRSVIGAIDKRAANQRSGRDRAPRSIAKAQMRPTTVSPATVSPAPTVPSTSPAALAYLHGVATDGGLHRREMGW